MAPLLKTKVKKNVLLPKWTNKSTGVVKSKENQVCKTQGEISGTHHLLSFRELAPAHIAWLDSVDSTP